MNLAKALVMRLDQPSARPGNINVVYLRNAEAVKLAQMLRGVLSGDAGRGWGPARAASEARPRAAARQRGNRRDAGRVRRARQPGCGHAQGSTPATTAAGQPGRTGAGSTTFSAGGAIIAADPSTNSLIITAPEPVYRNLRAVIDKLDARRAQVYIESLIVEVSAEKAAEFGVQWQFLTADPQTPGRLIGGTNLPARGSGANILDVIAEPRSRRHRA